MRRRFITVTYAMASVMMALILLILVLLTSCSNKEYITVEKTRTDTLYKYKVRVDSVVKFDSVTTTIKGDTIYRDRWHTLHVYHSDVDTVYRVRIVKEPQPYPVEKIVEVNRLLWWQETLMWTGVLALLVAIWMIKRKLS